MNEEAKSLRLNTYLCSISFYECRETVMTMIDFDFDELLHFVSVGSLVTLTPWEAKNRDHHEDELSASKIILFNI